MVWKLILKSVKYLGHMRRLVQFKVTFEQGREFQRWWMSATCRCLMEIGGLFERHWAHLSNVLDIIRNPNIKQAFDSFFVFLYHAKVLNINFASMLEFKFFASPGLNKVVRCVHWRHLWNHETGMFSGAPW